MNILLAMLNTASGIDY